MGVDAVRDRHGMGEGVLCDCGERGRDGMGWACSKEEGKEGRKEGAFPVRASGDREGVGEERMYCTVLTVLTPFVSPRRAAGLVGCLGFEKGVSRRCHARCKPLNPASCRRR